MQPYVGRFAPSPSGPLHFGSLVAALASYLDARAHGGAWLLRIDDLDPPREVAGAAQKIIDALRCHGLQWDGEICWQSQRGAAYDSALKILQHRHLVYFCDCTRAMLAELGGAYQGHCRDRGLAADTPSACRLRLDERIISFTDLFQGPQSCCPRIEDGDFVIRRKDRLYAYQLAVVVDDAGSGITHVVRGADLIESCGRQIYLQQVLGLDTPVYGHVPVASTADGRKLSKQNQSPAIERHAALDNLLAALRFLGQAVPAQPQANSAGLLRWAIVHWDRNRVPRKMALAHKEHGWA
jgi:glutamyl-Q tRNA(Asp) synthetase